MFLPLLFVSLLQAAPRTERPFALMIGDAAPALQVAEWVQGKPIASFDPARTYVVEFWATWCGPCKVAIPHLNELSKHYAGKVQFIGVSVWEHIDEKQPYSVPQFVQEMGEKMTYTVAADQVAPSKDAGPMAKGWMEAAGQTGIPTAFIVQGGRVAWIGHPMAIEKPLADVVAGSYDLEAAAKQYEQEARLKGASTKLAREITKAKKDKDFARALALIDEAVAKEPALEAGFGLNRYFLLLEAQRTSEAATYGQRLVSQVLADNSMALNQLAWTIVDPQGKWKDGDFALAVQAAERASKLLDDRDASTLDTLGLALFRAGQVARAIEVQTLAVELAHDTPELLSELQGRLEEFKKGRKAP